MEKGFAVVYSRSEIITIQKDLKGNLVIKLILYLVI